MKVFKFGGASVKDADAIKNVAQIIKGYNGQQIAIVVSAMGKTTNALEAIVDAFYGKTGEAFDLLEALKSSHYEILSQLFPQGHAIFDAINDTFVEIEWIIEEEPQESYDYLYDQIVSIGEFVSTKIVSAYLQQHGIKNTWLDVRDCILTDNTYREGQVDWKVTEQRVQQVIPSLLEKGMVVTQGFVGGTSENFTTTLGREGSDYTAAILSYCLNAESMTVWKDVPGILTADPRKFKNVTKMDRISYREAIEMTYYGAKVIHPKTIKPLQNKNIPLFVKSFIDPTGSGTMISSTLESLYPPVVVVATDQALIHISRRDFSFVTEDSLGELFMLFNKHRVRVNMMQNTAISFSICTDNKKRRIDNLLADLEENYKIIRDEGMELVTIRHYRPDLLKSLKKNKMVILEERIKNTVQMVMRDLPIIERMGE